VIYVAQSFF